MLNKICVLKIPGDWRSNDFKNSVAFRTSLLTHTISLWQKMLSEGAFCLFFLFQFFNLGCKDIGAQKVKIQESKLFFWKQGQLVSFMCHTHMGFNMFYINYAFYSSSYRQDYLFSCAASLLFSLTLSSWSSSHCFSPIATWTLLWWIRSTKQLQICFILSLTILIEHKIIFQL